MGRLKDVEDRMKIAEYLHSLYIQVLPAKQKLKIRINLKTMENHSKV